MNNQDDITTSKEYKIKVAIATRFMIDPLLIPVAIAGAMFETHAFVEIRKRWWHRMASPPLYYYRDKDAKEIDLLFFHDRTLYPLEIKLGASPNKDWIRNFPTLRALKLPIGEGGVVCLAPEPLPLDRSVTAIPIGMR